MDITQSLEITRTTYRVADFLSWQRGSNLNLRPPFQRGSVWSAKANIPSAQPMRSAYLSIEVDTDAEAERIFAALSEGGEVFMPMQETFFATRFGQLRDRFGINWMIVHER